MVLDEIQIDELEPLIRMLQDRGVSEFEYRADGVRLRFHPPVAEAPAVEHPERPTKDFVKPDRTSPYVKLLGELPAWPKAAS